MKTNPSLGLNVSFTARAQQVAAKAGSKDMAFSIPPNSTMPCIGDKFTVMLGGMSTTFKVIDREFEYLPDHATIHLTLDLP